MKTFNHLIAQHGVLISFSIAKKLNRESIKAISDEINKLGGDKKTRNQLLEEEIKRNTMDSMKLTDVPGLIMSKTEIVKEKFMDNSFMKDDKKVISLMILSNLLSKKILDKKAPKEQMCFILISMINSFIKNIIQIICMMKKKMILTTLKMKKKTNMEMMTNFSKNTLSIYHNRQQ